MPKVNPIDPIMYEGLNDSEIQARERLVNELLASTISMEEGLSVGARVTRDIGLGISIPEFYINAGFQNSLIKIGDQIPFIGEAVQQYDPSLKTEDKASVGDRVFGEMYLFAINENSGIKIDPHAFGEFLLWAHNSTYRSRHDLNEGYLYGSILNNLKKDPSELEYSSAAFAMLLRRVKNSLSHSTRLMPPTGNDFKLLADKALFFLGPIVKDLADIGTSRVRDFVYADRR